MSQNAKSSPQTYPTLSYADAGVNIDRGNQFIEEIKPLAESTRTKNSLNRLGGFGALFDMGATHYQDPILVSGTDGVGTKLQLAIDMKQHDTIGIDLVAMCVNDILVHGAQPLFFLDYFSCGELKTDHAKEVVQGIANGCKSAECALVGGETAEMPGMYTNGKYDLAGFCVGAVERNEILDGRQNIGLGDRLIGIASSGPHANGYSLIRKIIASSGTVLTMQLGNKQLGEVLIEPTKIYVKSIKKLLKDCNIKALAHITGGGIPDNLPRVMPDNVKTCIDRSTWQIPEIFNWLKETGNVKQDEMYRTFNCGVGMVVVVAETEKEKTIKNLQASGEDAWEIGQIENRTKKDKAVCFLN